MPMYACVSGSIASILRLQLRSADEGQQSVPDPDLAIAVTRCQYACNDIQHKTELLGNTYATNMQFEGDTVHTTITNMEQL